MQTVHETSIHIMWLACTGMRYSHPVTQAHYELDRLTNVLPEGSIRSSADVRAIEHMLSCCAEHVPEGAIGYVRRLLEIRNPAFRPVPTVRLVA